MKFFIPKGSPIRRYHNDWRAAKYPHRGFIESMPSDYDVLYDMNDLKEEDYDRLDFSYRVFLHFILPSECQPWVMLEVSTEFIQRIE